MYYVLSPPSARPHSLTHSHPFSDLNRSLTSLDPDHRRRRHRFLDNHFLSSRTMFTGIPDDRRWYDPPPPLFLHIFFPLNGIVIALENRKFPLIILMERALIFLSSLTEASVPRVADFKAAAIHCTITPEQNICPISNTRSNLNSQVI